MEGEARRTLAAVNPRGPEDPPSDRSRPLFWALLAGTILYLLALLPAAMLAMMSPMAADSGVTGAVYVFVYAAIALPVALVLCPLAAWLCWFMRWNRAAWALLALPCALPVLMIAAMAS